VTRRWSLVVAVVAVVGLGGCGASIRHRDASQQNRVIKYFGGAYTLASDRVPEGAAFSIIGQRYRFWGHDYLELKVHFIDPARVDAGGGGSEGWEGLDTNQETGCEVEPFTIFYGVLMQPRDGVLLHGNGRPFRTRKVALPAALDTHGVLVYGTTTGSSLRVELLLRTRTGKLKREFVSNSYERPGSCSTWNKERAHRARMASLMAETSLCLRRSDFTLIPPPYATPYLAAYRQCSKEAERTFRARDRLPAQQ
jgi:hypothetical protein